MLEIEPNAGCTEYCSDPPEGAMPCICPVCKGFIKWDDNGEPHCNKCGVELVLVPDIDEDTGEALEWGKICAIGKPKPKEVQTEELRVKRLCAKNAKKWKAFL